MDLWLPLTQDTRQQGLSNASVTAVGSGATINANGKLGKCYYLDGTSNGYITTDFPTNFGTNDFTISLWVKIPTISSGSYYTIVSSKQSPAISVGVGIYWNYSQKRFLWSTADGTNTTEIWMADAVDTIVYDKWIHLVMVRDNNDSKKGCFYINGTRYELASVPVIRNITTATNLWVGKLSSGNYPCKLYISDIRVWNGKALAPKEIEILSRGLVAHYPLNGGGRGGDNLLKNTADLTLWIKEAGITTTWDSEKNMYKIEDSAHTNSRWGIYQDINVEANTSYTITVTLDGTACGAGFAVYDSSTSFPPAVIGTTGRQSYTLTSGANSTKARVYLYTNCGVSKVAWFSLPKVEKGDKSTPWMPNSADAEFAAMGYDSTTEYDVSGYGHNGKNQYITYETDTPRYSVSSVLSGSSTRITNTTINIGNEWSYGLWFKSAAAARSWEGLVILNNNGGDSDIQLGFYTYPNNSRIQTTANGQYNTISHTYDNKWHHLFATFDGTTLKTYRDGELVDTKTITNSLLSRSNLTLGARYKGGTTFDCPFKGSLGDFRLYATALSAEQVAELYNTAVSVANNGALLGYELVEV